MTLVAPRVAGQVSRVLVDDNYRVKKGDLLVQLDKEPYQVQVDIKKAAVATAEADVKAAQSQVRGTLALARSQRWKLQRSMEHVDDTVALLRARVAALRSKEATLDRARADFDRAEQLFSRGAIAREEFDQRREAERTAEAVVKQALEEVHETRVSLGLARSPEKGDLADVPADLNQNFSGRPPGARRPGPEHRAGRPPPHLHVTRRPSKPSMSSSAATRRGTSTASSSGSCPSAGGPAGRGQARSRPGSDLAQAELNLRYCDVASEIDGLVTRRNVNPGNNVQRGRASWPSARSPRSGSMPTSRRRSSPTCASASGCAARWTCTGAGASSRAGSPASPWGPARPSPCSRRRTPPATS